LVKQTWKLFREIDPRLVGDTFYSKLFNDTPSLRRMFPKNMNDQYRKLIPTSAFAWLAQVATEQYWTLETDEHRAIADQMLSNNAVLRYLNDRDWFDLHPAVREIPGVAEAIRRRKADASRG